MTEPFLFDDMLENSGIIELPLGVEIKSYNTPIEQASLDIMEEVDLFFRSSITVEEYDTVQKKVKKILTEAFGEKSNNIPTHRLINTSPCPDDV